LTKKIVIFNHKGGVSKTTTTFHLGWMLAEKGKKVILADFDSQCNLTGLVLDYKSAQDLEALYADKPECNVKAGLAPAFESKPELIKPIECIEVEKRKNLFLIPGHMGLADYETVLGISQELTGPLQALKNLPGAISYLLDVTAEKYGADYILIDTSPSLGPVNRNIVMTSDYFLVPTGTDFFSVMSIDSLAEIFPKWKKWALQLSKLDVFNEAVYPFTASHTKFLGIIIQNYRRYGGEQPAESFAKWFKQIQTKVKTKLEVVLQENDLLMPDVQYSKIDYESEKFTLATIPNFNSLIAKSQEDNVPVFALTGSAPMMERKEEFRKIFDDLAEKIIKLTDDA